MNPAPHAASDSSQTRATVPSNPHTLELTRILARQAAQEHFEEATTLSRTPAETRPDGSNG